MKQIAIAVGLVMFGTVAFGQSAPASAPTPKTQAAPTPPPQKPAAKSKEWKIQNALSAAPRSIGKDATVMDYPDKQGGEMPVLRKGASDWTCLPDDPATPANDPMCMDKNAMAWAEGWMAKKEPKLTGPGIGYMLQGAAPRATATHSRRNRLLARSGSWSLRTSWSSRRANSIPTSTRATRSPGSHGSCGAARRTST